jgi:hypothetical protein
MADGAQAARPLVLHVIENTVVEVEPVHGGGMSSVQIDRAVALFRRSLVENPHPARFSEHEVERALSSGSFLDAALGMMDERCAAQRGVVDHSGLCKHIRLDMLLRQIGSVDHCPWTDPRKLDDIKSPSKKGPVPIMIQSFPLTRSVKGTHDLSKVYKRAGYRPARLFEAATVIAENRRLLDESPYVTLWKPTGEDWFAMEFHSTKKSNQYRVKVRTDFRDDDPTQNELRGWNTSFRLLGTPLPLPPVPLC